MRATNETSGARSVAALGVAVAGAEEVFAAAELVQPTASTLKAIANKKGFTQLLVT
jgi:hypothetical protein